MNINIFGEHMTVTDSIQSYINEKFSHLHTPEKLTNVEFRIGTTKTDQYVHFHANVPGESIVIKTSDKNLYHAIDSLMNKIHLAFTKEKGKHQQRLSAQFNLE